jgi:hypothetical protein
LSFLPLALFAVWRWARSIGARMTRTRTRRYVTSHSTPAEWRDDEDVEAWLAGFREQVSDIGVVLGDAPVDVDPTTPVDLSVGVVVWDDGLWEDTGIIADPDPNRLEAKLAGDLWERLSYHAEGAEPGDFLYQRPDPDLADPDAVSAWLAAARQSGTVVFTTHYARLDPARAAGTGAPTAGADAAVVSAVPSASRTESVAVVAGIWWASDPEEEPDLVVGRSLVEVQRQVATRLWEQMHDEPGKPRMFTERHDPPARWHTVEDVGDWLEAVVT